MNNPNYEALHSFVEGMKTDWDNHAETDKSFQNGVNGRLYSHNGTISYSSVQGTKKIYTNNLISSINGYWAFDKELVLFVKADRNNINQDGDQTDFEVVEVFKLLAKNKDVNIDFEEMETVFDFEDAVFNYSTFEIKTTEEEPPLIFDNTFSEVQQVNANIDLSEYFTEYLNDDHFEVCTIETQEIPKNNIDYVDLILSLRMDDEGELHSKTIWSGNLNIPLNAKIVTHGVHENNFFKRVYFTDYVNPFRVVNIQDKKSSTRKSSEFATFQNVPMLRPKVVGTNDNGQVPAGTCIYAYRLITENGQITTFSPLSDDIKIIADEGDITYAGGHIGQVTSKAIEVQCNLINFKNFKEIECVAIEFQALGAPTAIRSLGIQKVGAVVTFLHTGGEKEFDSSLSLSDILERAASWSFCSDIHSKSNLLIASGLRNEPLPSYLLNITHLFALHAWDAHKNTFSSYINPDPVKYRFIHPKTKTKMFVVEKKLYSSIQAFESFEIKLINENNNEFVSTEITQKENLRYEEYLEEIRDWLFSIKDTSEFKIKFPSVKIEWIQQKILFTSENNVFDFSKLKFNYSTSQVIEDFKEDVKFVNLNSVQGDFVHGYESLGFNQGNGIRITFKPEHKLLAKKATKPFSGSTPILEMKKPSNKRYFMKGEIYRIGIQVWLSDGSQPFVITCGDIKIPEIGENIMHLDIENNPKSTYSMDEAYVNGRVIDDGIYSEAITLDVQVRLSCEIQKKVSMYQIVYVERTDENRTILCQGVAGPLERINTFYHSNRVSFREATNNKWALPMMGGPVYDYKGLQLYDQDPNMTSPTDNPDNHMKRVVTARNLFSFDAPDVIYNRVSSDKIKNGVVHVLKKLNHDGRRQSIYTSDSESYPAFSRKIPISKLQGEQANLPYEVNFSFFLERNMYSQKHNISYAIPFKQGEILPGSAFSMHHSVSNNAPTLARPRWHFLEGTREDHICNNVNNSDGDLHFELYRSNNFAVGNDTVIIKTSSNLFTNTFISQTPIQINANEGLPKDFHKPVYPAVDTYALINILMNTSEFIYGGRSEVAYSKNVYTPLGETIPVLKGSNNTQRFTVYGDTYCTLFIRAKTLFSGDSVWETQMENSYNCARSGHVIDRTRWGAWAYVAVLETTIEPRWSSDDMFYKNKDKITFDKNNSGEINEAYLQRNNIKNYIPKPYNFEDDPNLNNIVSISKPKLNGEVYDSFSSFPANNFYELEKDKGTAFNLAKFLDKIYVIQEHQTSELIINENVMIDSSNGQINMKQGDGNRISGHNVVSNYGTSIRRAVVESISNNRELGGFTFIDEKRLEWIKNISPKLVEKNLQLKFSEIFEADPIVDTEGYYDDEHKETNIRITTKSGLKFMLSFSERFDAFNGWVELDSDIFIMWDNKVLAPNADNSEIHRLNAGKVLEFFEEEKNMVLKITTNINPNTVKIFKAWAGNINIDYPVERIIIETSSGQTRVITKEHIRYQISEGVHNVPLKNQMDWDDLRGEWASVEIEIAPKDNQKINVYSLINFVRQSTI